EGRFNRLLLPFRGQGRARASSRGCGRRVVPPRDRNPAPQPHVVQVSSRALRINRKQSRGNGVLGPVPPPLGASGPEATRREITAGHRCRHQVLRVPAARWLENRAPSLKRTARPVTGAAGGADLFALTT